MTAGLLAGDAELVEREPDMPGLATVLDPAALVALLAEQIPADTVSAARARYVRYKPATSCLVAYELCTASGTILAYARAHHRERVGKLARVRSRPSAKTALGMRSFVADAVGVEVRLLPYDPELPALRALTKGRRSKTIGDAIAGFDARRPVELTPLRYKPERRYVARLDGEGFQAVIKAYAREDYPRAAAAARAFRNGRRLRLPAHLGQDDARRLLLHEWRDEPPLREQLGDRDGARAALATGAALAELHAQHPGSALPVADPRRERQSVDSAQRAVSALLPRLAEPSQLVAARTSEMFVRGPVTPAALHGDFSRDQVLCSGTSATILDLDEARHGDAAADLGSFAAELEYAVLIGQVEPRSAATALAALRQGYRDVAGATPQDRVLRAYTAAALLRRAVEPFRYRLPNWPALAAAAVHRAKEIADDA